MGRSPLALVVPDASRFARQLGQTLHQRHAAGQAPPGHVELLNLIARALGHRNLQSLQAAAAEAERADGPGAEFGKRRSAGESGGDPIGNNNGQNSGSAAAQPRPSGAPLPAAPLAAEDRAPPVLSGHARKALMHFDSRDRLARWPAKFSVQRLALWLLWVRFDGRRVYGESEVNAVLKAANDFGDHVTLRRELVNHRLLTRTPDCREYRKLPAEPDGEARAVLAAWRWQRRQAAS